MRHLGQEISPVMTTSIPLHKVFYYYIMVCSIRQVFLQIDFYALQDRGTMFIKPGEEIYLGQSGEENEEM